MEKHPELKEKLTLLYALQLNPLITSNSDLAKEIGRSRQAISRWCIGTETSHGNSIPLDSVSLVAKAFGIDPMLLTLPLKEFESGLKLELKNNSGAMRIGEAKTSTSTLPITDAAIFGRDVELSLLTELWHNPRMNLMQIVAFGGAGKTSLVNKWLSNLSKESYRGAENIYAWSFY